MSGNHAQLRSLLKTAGEVRDGILVALSCTYALGFAVWSLYAWRQGLGWLPVANSRYFIAGLPLLFTILAGYALMQSRQWLKEWASRDAPRRTVIVRWLTITAMVATVLLEGLVEPIYRTSWSIPAWEVFVVFKLVVFVLFLALVLVDSELQGQTVWVTDWIMRGGIVVGTLFVIWGFLALVDQFYPLLPQEFGGTKPRVAVLHLRVSDLSPSLRLALLARSDGQAAEIRESREVLVLYADTARLIFKVPPDLGHANAADVVAAPAYELHTDAIRAVTYPK